MSDLATSKRLIEDVKTPSFFSHTSDVHPRIQAKKIDSILGFRTKRIEQQLLKKYRAYYKVDDIGNGKELRPGSQTWIGLHPQVLQTPYSEILHFFWLLRKHEIKSVVDLGSGYGRVAIVMKSIFPKASFLGYEIVDVRVRESRRMFEQLQLSNCEILEEDILQDDFNLPTADLYFIYDFSDPKDIRQILSKLSQRLRSERFFLVAKGEGIRSLIQLKFPEFWAVHGAIHRKNWSLYSSYVDLS